MNIKKTARLLVCLLAVTGLCRGTTRDVKVFGGATGNGSTDDKTAIQNTVNACAAGDTVSFPAGTFKVSGTVTIKSNCNYVSTSNAVILGYVGTGLGGYPIFATDSTASNGTITGLIFDGGGVAFRAGTNSTLGNDWASNWTIKNNTFRNIINGKTDFNYESNCALASFGVGLQNSVIQFNTFSHIMVADQPTHRDGAGSDPGDWHAGVCMFHWNNVKFTNNTFDYVTEGVHIMEDPNYNGPSSPGARYGRPGTYDADDISFNTFLRIHRCPIEIQAYFFTHLTINNNQMLTWANPFWASFAISHAANAVGSQIKNNYITTDVAGVYGIGIELSADQVVASNNTVRAVAGTQWTYGVTWFQNTTNLHLTNNSFCGSYVLGAIQTSAMGALVENTGNTVSGSCSGGDVTAPTVPTSLAASAVSSSQINLTWTASTDAGGVTGYKIFRGGVQITTSLTNSYSDTGLAASTLYSYTVAAYDAAGNTSAQSSAATATTQAPAGGVPTAPTSLSASNSSVQSLSATLNWTDNSATETGTKIMRRQTAGGASFAQVGSVAANVHTFIDTGAGTALTNNFQYDYEVIAFNGTGDSNPSNIVSVTVSTTNVVPVVALTTPTAAQHFTSPGSVSIAATATDSDGTITSVAFYAGSTLVGTDATSPYTFVWSGMASGAYSITARATDNSGGVTTSAAVVIVIGALIDVKAYGAAVGDGISDDYTPIQNSINICASGDTVRFPAGTYRVSTTLALHSNCTYTSTAGAILVGFTATTAGGYDIFDTGNTSTNIAITGLTFTGGGIKIGNVPVGGSGTVDWNDGITITGNTFQNITNSSTWNCYAENAICANGLRGSTISNNIFSNILSGGLDTVSVVDDSKSPAAIAFFYAYNLTISGNTCDHVHNCIVAYQGNTAGAQTPPVNPTGGTGGKFDNLRIFGNTMTRVHRKGIEIVGGYQTNTLIANNSITAFVNAGQQTYGIGFEAGWDDLAYNALTSQVRNNFVDLTGATGAAQAGYCMEVWGKGTVADSNVCKSGAGSTSHFKQGAAIGGINIIISNNTFCGTYDEPSVSYNGAYAAGSPAPGAQILTNLTPTSCTGIVAPPPFNVSGADQTAPTVPTGLTASPISNSAINLAWTASTDLVGVTGYKVFRGGVQVATSAVNNYADTGLLASTLYVYTVSAFDAAGNVSAQSSSASATTQAVAGGTPTPASLLTTSNTSSNTVLSATLAWHDNASNESGFKIMRKSTHGVDAFAQVGTAATNAVSFVDTGAVTALNNTWEYDYQVIAYNANGNASPSNSSTIQVINQNQLPTLTLGEPADAQHFTAPATISIVASADDSDGVVTKVDIYNGLALLTSIPRTTTLFGYDWVNVPAGTYMLTAKATDDSGGVTTAPTITIVVDPSTGTTLNVTSYGATGNGTTDDLIALQAASDACTAGGTVNFPGGTYKISATVNIKSNCTYSSTAGAIILGYTGTSTAGYALFTAPAASMNINIIGLTFKGGGIRIGATTTAAAGTVDWSEDITVSGCTFQDLLALSSATDCGAVNGICASGLRNSTLTNNEFSGILPANSDNAASGGAGISLYFPYNLVISANTMDHVHSGVKILSSNLSGGGTPPLNPTPGTNGKFDNLRIYNNILTRVHAQAIQVQAGYLTGALIANNSVSGFVNANTSTYGVSFSAGWGTLSFNATTSQIRNNFVDLTSATGAQAGLCYEVWGVATLLDGNVCKSNNTGVIHFLYAVAIGGPSTIVSNNILAGTYDTLPIGYTGAYSAATPAPGTVLITNTTPASPSGISAPAFFPNTGPVGGESILDDWQDAFPTSISNASPAVTTWTAGHGYTSLKAFALLTFSGAGNVANGDIVTIDGIPYPFKTSLTSCSARDVKIGADYLASALNLYHAINALASNTQGPGLTYCGGTSAHLTSEASLWQTNILQLRYRTPGSSGNGIAVAETGANMSLDRTSMRMMWPVLVTGATGTWFPLNTTWYGIATVKDMTSAGTTLRVSDCTPIDIPADLSATVQVGSEEMLMTAKATANNACNVTVTRHANGTSAAAHPAGITEPTWNYKNSAYPSGTPVRYICQYLTANTCALYKDTGTSNPVNSTTWGTMTGSIIFWRADWSTQGGTQTFIHPYLGSSGSPGQSYKPVVSNGRNMMQLTVPGDTTPSSCSTAGGGSRIVDACTLGFLIPDMHGPGVGMYRYSFSAGMVVSSNIGTMVVTSCGAGGGGGAPPCSTTGEPMAQPKIGGIVYLINMATAAIDSTPASGFNRPFIITAVYSDAACTSVTAGDFRCIKVDTSPYSLANATYAAASGTADFLVAFKQAPYVYHLPQIVTGSSAYGYSAGMLWSFTKSGPIMTAANPYNRWRANIRYGSSGLTHRADGGDNLSAAGEWQNVNDWNAYPTLGLGVNHFYHGGNINTYSGAWGMWEIVPTPSLHVSSHAPSVNYPNNPLYQGFMEPLFTGAQLGQTPRHYFDAMNAWYWQYGPAQVGGVAMDGVYLYDRPRFDTVTVPEPEEFIMNRYIIWATTRKTAGNQGYELSFGVPKYTNGTYVAKLSTTGSLKTNGFSTGTTFGSGVSPGGYNNVFIESPTMPKATDIWVGVRATMPIRSCTGISVSPIWCFTEHDTDPMFLAGEHVTVAGVGGNTVANQTNAALAGVKKRAFFWVGDPQYPYEPYPADVDNAAVFSDNGGAHLVRVVRHLHLLTTGDRAEVLGAGGNANGIYTVTVVDANTITLNSTVYATVCPSGCSAGFIRKFVDGGLTSVVSNGAGAGAVCTANFSTPHNMVVGYRFTLMGSNNALLGGNDDQVADASPPYYKVKTVTSSTVLTMDCPNVPSGTYQLDLGRNDRMVIESWAGFALTGTGNAAYTSGGTVVSTEENFGFAEIHFTPPDGATVTPTVTTASLPTGINGTAYSQTLTATGGTAPYTWAVLAGTLPTGLSLDAGTGEISGTPSVSGTSSGLQFRVTDSLSQTADSGVLSIVINPSSNTRVTGTGKVTASGKVSIN